MLARGSTEHVINLAGQSLVLVTGLAALWLGLRSLSPPFKDPSRSTSWRDAIFAFAQIVSGIAAGCAGLRLIFLAADAILSDRTPIGLLKFIWDACSR